MARPARPVDLDLELPDDSAPLRHRIADALVEGIASGRLRPGDPLPPTRGLAKALGVARAAVVDAYDQLQAAGFAVAVAGSGTFVAPGADRAARLGAASHVAVQPVSQVYEDRGGRRGLRPADPRVDRGRGGRRPTNPQDPAEPESARSYPAGPAVRWDCRPGHPDPALVNLRDWRRAWAQAATVIPDDVDEQIGYLPLRQALCQQLRRTRGVVVGPDELLLLPGVAISLRAVFDGLGLAPGTHVAIEDPGYRRARTALEDLGLVPRGVPVDADGLEVGRLRPDDAAVYVTPAHQYPLGGRLPVERRGDLLAWAARHDAVIVEDDYDGEFRYGVPPLPALRAMSGAGDHVVYLGTASKLLTSGLRLAWLVAPERLRDPLVEACRRFSLRVDGTAAGMLAQFIDSGALTRHLARASREYAHRLDALRRAIQRRMPSAELVGVDAGLHVVLTLGDDTDDVALVDRLAQRGLLVEPLSVYCLAARRPGLVIGYSMLPATRAPEVAEQLALECAATG